MAEPKPAPTAASVCRLFKPGDEAQALLGPEHTPTAFVTLLGEKLLFADAFAFIAHWLPKRAAVWWGCLCIWKTARPTPTETSAAALQTAVRWVQKPTEETRRAAERAAEAAGLGTPAGALAMAAFCSDGSLSRADLPPAPAPPLLTAQTVAAAVLLAANENMSTHGPAFIQLGLDVASGKNRWEGAK